MDVPTEYLKMIILNSDVFPMVKVLPNQWAYTIWKCACPKLSMGFLFIYEVNGDTTDKIKK